MKVQTTIRVDKDKLQLSKEILSNLGLTFSEAVNLFTNMIVQTKGLPFEIRLSDEMLKRIEDVENNRNLEEVSFEELKEDISKCIK